MVYLWELVNNHLLKRPHLQIPKTPIYKVQLEYLQNPAPLKGKILVLVQNQRTGMKGSNKILKRLKSCELMKLKQTLGNYLKTLCWRRMDNSLKFFQDRKKRKIRQNLLPLLKGKDSKITLRLLKTSSHHEVSLLEYKRYFKP